MDTEKDKNVKDLAEDTIATGPATPNGYAVASEPVVSPVETKSAGDIEASPEEAQSAPLFRDVRGDRNNRRQGSRQPRRREARAKPEFDQKIVSLRRVTRVMAGGRRFNFSVCVVAGNRKGSVGVGQGKAADTQLAIDKALRDAKKNMILVNTTNKMSIPHDVEAKYAASWVKIMPLRGKGILAGSSVRTVLEMAGLKEIGAKLLSRSKNGINNAYAALKALDKLKYTKVRNKN